MTVTQGEVVARLGAALAGPEGALAAWVGVADPVVAETLARAGFDTAVLDLQHGAFDVASANQAIATLALAGTPAIARVPVDDFPTASRLLDMGAAGIIAPMINTAEDAARLVAFTKFPPVGERSWGPRRVLDIAGLTATDYFRDANALHRVFVMIETRAALTNLDAILAVQGIDGVFVGPSDLSVALSGGAGVDPVHPDVEAALDHVAARAAAAGKPAGLFCFSGAKAREMRARGFALRSIATDLLLLRAAAAAEIKAARLPDRTNANPRSQPG